MSDQEIANSEPEQTPGLRAFSDDRGSGTPAPMDEWWKTPASLVPPPAVDPAIYGIDASDVGLDPHESAHANGAPSASPGLSGSERIAQMLTRTDIEGGLDEYIGLSSADSAQSSGPPPKTSGDHTKASNGHRANALAAQLQLAAKGIDDLRTKLEQAMQAPMGERSPDAVAQHLISVLADVKQEREALVLVFQEQTRTKLKEPVVRDAFLQASRSSKLLDGAVGTAQALARRSGATADDVKKIEVNSKLVNGDVNRLAKDLGVDVTDDVNAPAVTKKEAALQLEAVRESLAGLDESSQGLVTAMRESDPKTAMPAVLPGLLSNARILEASLVDGLRPDRLMVQTGARIKVAMETAWRDAQPFGLQTDASLREAHDRVPPVLQHLDKLAKGKK